MERLTKEQAFQLHYELENIDESLIEIYDGDTERYDDREGWVE